MMRLETVVPIYAVLAFSVDVIIICVWCTYRMINGQNDKSVLKDETIWLHRLSLISMLLQSLVPCILFMTYAYPKSPFYCKMYWKLAVTAYVLSLYILKGIYTIRAYSVCRYMGDIDASRGACSKIIVTFVTFSGVMGVGLVVAMDELLYADVSNDMIHCELAFHPVLYYASSFLLLVDIALFGSLFIEMMKLMQQSRPHTQTRNRLAQHCVISVAAMVCGWLDYSIVFVTDTHYLSLLALLTDSTVLVYLNYHLQKETIWINYMKLSACFCHKNSGFDRLRNHSDSVDLQSRDQTNPTGFLSLRDAETNRVASNTADLPSDAFASTTTTIEVAQLEEMVEEATKHFFKAF
eukprot:682490_1